MFQLIYSIKNSKSISRDITKKIIIIIITKNIIIIIENYTSRVHINEHTVFKTTNVQFHRY